MTGDIALDELKFDHIKKEEIKIKEFLKRVDNNYYHRKIENRLKEMKKFPHLGESGTLFVNTYSYVNLAPRKRNK